MLKVSTIFFMVTGMLLMIHSCNIRDDNNGKEMKDHVRDSLAEIRIDSAYTAINKECDTLMKYKVPELVQALIRKDSLFISSFSDSLCYYSDSVTRAEKVIRQLKQDCDSNLLRETYRRVQQLQKVKSQQQHRKRP